MPNRIYVSHFTFKLLNSCFFIKYNFIKIKLHKNVNKDLKKVKTLMNQLSSALETRYYKLVYLKIIFSLKWKNKTESSKKTNHNLLKITFRNFQTHLLTITVTKLCKIVTGTFYFKRKCLLIYNHIKGTNVKQTF